MSQRQLALLTGWSITIMAIVATCVMGLIYAPIFGMSITEFSNSYLDLKELLKIGLIGWIVILLCDLIVSWSLYKLYKKANTSKIMGILRFVYSIILALAISKLFSASFLSTNEQESYHSIQNFQSIWQFGLIVFGVHLLYLAPLVCQKRTIRMLISGLLLIAGIGYILTNTLSFLFSNYVQIQAVIEPIFIIPMVFGELGLALWLLFKGGKAN